MHFMWLIFLFWIKGHSMRGWLKLSTQKSHTGQPIECLRLLCLLKVRLFYYQYFTSASRETREMNCLLANGWRWRWDSDFQNKHRAQGLANKSLYTHTHTQTQEPLCAVTLIYRKRNVLIGQPRSVMASETPLMLRERVVKSTEVCFIYSLIYSIHSEGEHQWLWQAASWCHLSSKSSLKLKV